MNIAAVVIGGFGAPVDELSPLAGVPVLVRSLRTLLEVVPRAVVLIDDRRDPAPVVAACAGLPVDVRTGAQRALFPSRPHARQRPEDTDGDGFVTLGSSDVVLVHAAARPLAPAALVRAVLMAVDAGHPCAVPVLPLTDTVKEVDAAGRLRGTPDRAALRVVQTPQAFRVDAVRGLDVPALQFATHLAAVGVPVHAVPGDPAAFPVRTAWELEQAQLLLAGPSTRPAMMAP